MNTGLFNKFLISRDTLWVCNENKLIFTSNKDYLIPLLEYIDKFGSSQGRVKIFDRIMGNAAALLAVKADCDEVYSPLGSELAIKTLSNYDIRYHLTEIVPYIQNRDREAMCPMEKLSINKNPEEFYKALRCQRPEESQQTEDNEL